MLVNAPSKNNKPKTSVRETNFKILNYLCGRFQGLSPIEVLNADFSDIYELYVDSAINQVKTENNRGREERQWVTSQTASWH